MSFSDVKQSITVYQNINDTLPKCLIYTVFVLYKCISVLNYKTYHTYKITFLSG